MSNVSLMDPAVLKAGLTLDGDLKPDLTTPLYDGGVPQNADELKAGLTLDGDLKSGLLTAGGTLKPSLLK